MALDWNTGLYPYGTRNHWKWSPDQHETALLTIHEAGHAAAALDMGAHNVRLTITSTNATRHHGRVTYDAYDLDHHTLSPDKVASTLLMYAAGRQTELLWWSYFTSRYSVSRDTLRAMQSTLNPHEYSDDLVSINRLLACPSRYQGNLPAVEADAYRLVARQWWRITQITEQAIARRGHWAA